MNIQEMNSHAKKIALAHEVSLRPIQEMTDLPTTAISIMLFISSCEGTVTARDICEIRGLKRAIVSTHVERLVNEGYIERQSIKGDRRKDALVLTEKSSNIVSTGLELQKNFAERVLCGISDEDHEVLDRCFKLMNSNINKILKENNT